MSSANDPPGVPAAVLTHQATPPAVSITSQPTPDERAFDWTLLPKDLRLVLTHRGQENVLRFAVQLCVVKKHGRFLSDYTQVPAAVLGYLARPLEIEPLAALTSRGRDNTEGDYQREIATYLGWQSYDASVATRLRTWIAEQVAQYLYVDHLVKKAEHWLRENRIVIPEPVVFERAVNAAYRHAESIVFRHIAAPIPPAGRPAIDPLLMVDDPGGKTDCMRFAEYPPEAKAKHIVRFFERYRLLAALGLDQVRFTGVGRELLQRLAAAVRTYQSWQIRHFEPDKRYALAVCFLYEAKKTLLDDLVAMHAPFMTTMERHFRGAWEEEHRRLRHQVQRGVASLRNLATGVLTLRREPETPLSRLFEHVNAATIAAAVQDCEAFEQLQAHGYVNRLRARYGNFRRYFRHFIHLEFRAEPGSQGLLQAIELLRQLDAGTLKALLAAVDITFVPAAWRGRLTADPRGIDRRTWEIALALALRDALRAGEIYLPDSRRHVAFWDLCYDHAAWESQKPAAYQALGLPVEAEAALAPLVEEFRVTAAGTALNLPANPFAELVAGELRLKRDPALEEPAQAPLLRQLLAHRLAQGTHRTPVAGGRCALSVHRRPETARPHFSPSAPPRARVAGGADRSRDQPRQLGDGRQRRRDDGGPAASGEPRLPAPGDDPRGQCDPGQRGARPALECLLRRWPAIVVRRTAFWRPAQFPVNGVVSPLLRLLRPRGHGLYPPVEPVQRICHRSDLLRRARSALRAGWAADE